MKSEASFFESIQECREQFCFLLELALKEGLIYVAEHISA